MKLEQLYEYVVHVAGVTAGGGGWEPLGTPYFDNSTKREATAAVGQPAYLHCRVRNLADRAVRLTCTNYLLFIGDRSVARFVVTWLWVQKCALLSGKSL